MRAHYLFGMKHSPLSPVWKRLRPRGLGWDCARRLLKRWLHTEHDDCGAPVCGDEEGDDAPV